MNAAQRLAIRGLVRMVPPLGRLLKLLGPTLDNAADEITLLRNREYEERLRRRRVADDLREAIALAGGPWIGPGPAGTMEIAPRESDSRAVVSLKERLAELELALEDRGWQRMLASAETEFSRWGIQQLILVSRLYKIKNPLVRRGVEVSASYIFGRGLEISSPDESANEVLQDFFYSQRNLAEIGHRALVEKEETLHTDGNLFLAFFTSQETGETVVRTIDAIEIEEIITDPDDQSIPWFYHRRWNQQNFDAATGVVTPKLMEGWYVAMGHEPGAVTQIKGKPLQLDRNGMPIPVLHVKVGGLPKWHFGCPLVYAALDWARAYKHFLEDWASLTRALSRFAWDVETAGGPAAIAGLKQTLATTLANDGLQIETNPPPVAGAAFIRDTGMKMTPYKTAGATTDPEHGRRVMLMVAAAFGLPETFFGDASTGSLATAVSLDRPTELKFLEAQERWREVIQRIAEYVLERSSTAPRGRLREARNGNPAPQKAIVEVKFPSILEHDVEKRVSAIVDSMTLKGKSVTGIDEKTGVGLLLAELGVEDVQAVQDAMYPEKSYEQDRTIEPEPEEITPQPLPQIGPSESVVAAAVAELQYAVTKMREKRNGEQSQENGRGR